MPVSVSVCGVFPVLVRSYVCPGLVARAFASCWCVVIVSWWLRPLYIDRIAHRMAEERGVELGCDKERVLGLFKQRTRCAVGVAAVRARTVARAARRPLVGCNTTAQANRLLAGSCSAHNSLKTPRQGGLEMLTAMAWKEDNGNRGPRGLRGD